MEFNDIFKYQGTFYASGLTKTKVKGWKRFDNSKIPDCLELIYCISGEDEVCVNGKTYLITPGTVRILPPSTQVNEEVWIRTLKNGEFVDVGFITKDPFVTETVVFNAQDNRKIHDLFMQLLKLHEKNLEKTGANFFEGSSVLFLLLYEIRQMLDVEGMLNKTLEPALKHIHEHYCDWGFSLLEVPQMCGLKKNQFYSMFKKMHNTTPSSYVINLRMQYAKKLLLETDLSIGDIAKKVGYESATYFSRVFRKQFGIIPSKYKSKFI